MGQLAEKNQQLNAQAALLADKDVQIATLNAKVTQLEAATAAKPATPIKRSKTKQKK